MSGSCSSRPATATSWPSTISAPAALAVGYPLPPDEWRCLFHTSAVHRSGRNSFCPARPVILNGIEDVITRPDLADRAILLTLAPIAERQRRPEHTLWREFELARPHILGALLDAAAQGLRMLPRVRLKCLPRMADFALWAAACESAFQPAGTLETAYSNNRRDAIENMIDADSVAACVRELMTDRAQWTGSASDLLQVGTSRTCWPKSPRALAGRLRRAQTFLRTLGIEIAFGREGRLGTRTIRITAIGDNQLHDTVSTVSRVSDTGRGARPKHSPNSLEQAL
jgi:hypothetical protein